MSKNRLQQGDAQISYCPENHILLLALNLRSMLLHCSWHQRIAEVGRNLWSSSDPTSCSSRATLKTFAHDQFSWLLNMSKDGHTTTSLDNLSQCSVTYTVKNVFHHVQREHPEFQFAPMRCLFPCNWADT